MTKSRSILFVAVLVLVLITGAAPIHAQDGEEGWQVYTNGNYVEDLALEDGGALAGGYTWAATNGGVICYSTSQQIKFTNLDGLADNNVRAVTLDGGGRPWFGTYGGGVSLLEDGGTPFDKGDDTWATFTTADGLVSDVVYAVIIDAAERLWFGTYDGVSVLDDGGTPFDKGDDIWASFTTTEGLVSTGVFAMAADAWGRMWFATYATNGGVSVLDHGGTPFNKADDAWVTFTETDGLADDHLKAVAVDGAGRVWIGTHTNGVNVLDHAGTLSDKQDDTWETFTTADGLAHTLTYDVTLDGSGRLWFGTYNGVSVLDYGGTPFAKGDDTWNTFTTVDGLAQKDVIATAADGSGRLWLGTEGGGVSVLDHSGTPFSKGDDSWSTLATADGLVHHYLLSASEDGGGRIWFGTWGGGASVLDDNGTPFDNGDDTWTGFTSADGLSDDQVVAIAEDSGGRLWFATYGNYVSVLDHGGTPFAKGDDTWIHFDDSDGLAHYLLGDLVEDSRGLWWFGTYGGVSVLDHGGTPGDKGDDTWITFTTYDGLAGNTVRSVLEDNEGRMWFGTASTVGVLDDGGTPFDKGDDTWTKFLSSDGLVHYSVNDQAADGAGRLWFATHGGVGVLDYGGTPHNKGDDTWNSFTTADGLASNSVYAVALDGQGRLWFGTGSAGVSVLDYGGTPFDKGDDTWTTFMPTDGLADDNVYDVIEDSQGNIWFGTYGGAGELVDDIAPSSSASSPDYDTGAPIPVSWSADDGASGVLDTMLWAKKGSGGTWTDTGLSQAGASGTFYYTPSGGDGTYYFATVAEDWLGNLEAAPSGSGDDSTIYDTLAPQSSASSPSYDNGGTIPVDWSANDAASGVDQTCLWYQYETGSWTKASPCQAGTSGTFDFSPVAGNGTYYFATQATDHVGNSEPAPTGSGDDSTVYDTAAPTITGPTAVESSDYLHISGTTIYYSDEMSTSPQAFYLTGGADDSTSGLDQAAFTAAFGEGPFTDSSPSTWTSGSYGVTAGDNGDGTVTVTVTDKAGNASYVHFPYVEDLIPATSTVTIVPGYTNQIPISVTWAADDPVSGLAETCLWYRYESGTWIQSDSCQVGTSGAFGFTPTDGAGTYYFATQATDNVANTEDPPSGDGDGSSLYDPNAASIEYHIPTAGGDTAWYNVEPSPSQVIDVDLTNNGGPGLDIAQYRVADGAWQTLFDYACPSSVTDYTADWSVAWTLLAEGANEVDIQVRKCGTPYVAHHYVSDASGFRYLKDTIAPGSEASAPDWDPGGSIPVSWTAGDAASGVSSTALWVKYESAGVWSSTGLSQAGTSGDFYYTPAQGDGTYYFATQATDNAGNVQAAPTFGGDANTVYDTVAPQSSASSPDYDNAGTIPVDWTASDATIGVKTVCLWYKYGTGTWTDSGTCESVTSGTFDFSAGSGDGTYSFATVATDWAGHAEAQPTGAGDDSTVYDTTAPTASASSPATASGLSFVVDWSGDDGSSGIASYDVQYRVESDGTWQDWKSNTSQTSATFGPTEPVTVQQEQTYYFRARARDQAGNLGTYAAEGDCATYVGNHVAYLPLVVRNLRTWDAYYEENDHWLAAYGPLAFDRAYLAYPNDADDYYCFELASTSMVNISLEAFAPTSTYGDLLLYGPASGDERGPLITYFGQPGHSSLSLGPESLGPGKYYIRVYVADRSYYSTRELYTLTVSY